MPACSGALLELEAEGVAELLVTDDMVSRVLRGRRDPGDEMGGVEVSGQRLALVVEKSSAGSVYVARGTRRRRRIEQFRRTSREARPKLEVVSVI